MSEAGRSGRATAEAGTAALPPLLAVPRTGTLPASDTQRRLYLLEQAMPDKVRPNAIICLRLRGPVDRDLLAEALRRVVARHEALRTVFRLQDGLVHQVVLVGARLDCGWLDLPTGPDLHQRVAAIGRDYLRRPFDLAHGPLIRMGHVAVTADESYLIVNCHHLISDGWSLHIMRRELAVAYAEFVAGREPALDPVPLHFADFAAWQQACLSGAWLDRSIAFWRQQLGTGPLQVPLLGRRPSPDRSDDGLVMRLRHLPEAPAAALPGVVEAAAATPFTVFLAVFGILVGHYGGLPEPVVGVPVLNRRQPGADRIVGFVANVLSIRLHGGGGDRAFADFVRHLRQLLLAVYEHQHVPPARLVEALYPADYMENRQLSNLLFNFLPFARDAYDGGGVTMELCTEALPPVLPTWYDLGFYVFERPAGWQIGIMHYRDYLSDDEAESFLDDFAHLAAMAFADPGITLGALQATLPRRS